MLNIDCINSLFYPTAVALIGASDRENSIGRSILDNLSNTTKKFFELYLINNKKDKILDKRCYKSILELRNKSIDLVVCASRAETVLDVVKDCASINTVKVIIVIAAGFKEIGKEGIDLENKIVALANEMNIAILGPNCLGIQSPHHELNASFAACNAGKGNVAFLSQSGAICCALLDWATAFNIGFSAFVSIGSMSHIQWGHLFEFFVQDKNTQSIIMYIETLGDVEIFIKAAIKLVNSQKRIYVIKAGKTESAVQAAISHTGSIAGSYNSFEAVMNRCGITILNSISELHNILLFETLQPSPTKNEAIIVTNAGGPGVLTADSCELNGIKLFTLPENVITQLNLCLPAAWSHNNPIDILGDGDVIRYCKTIEILLNSINTNVNILILLTPQSVTKPSIVAQGILDVINRSGKRNAPIICVWEGYLNTIEGCIQLVKGGIPAVFYPDEAAKCLSIWYNAAKKTPENIIQYEIVLNRRHMAETFIQPYINKGIYVLNEYVSKQILRLYNIETNDILLSESLEQAIDNAQRIGYPVVLKICSHIITHKAACNGVILNIETQDRLINEYNKLINLPIKDSIQEITVQKMITHSNYFEIIFGSYKDPQIGPVLIFGSGGTYTKQINDIKYMLPGITNKSAIDLFNQTKIGTLINHKYKHTNPNVTKLIVDSMCKFAELVSELSDYIQESDINPLCLNDNGCVALDARFIISQSSQVE